MKASMVCRLSFIVRGTCLTFLLVRNRARELVELLSDVEKIRTERRKAKANRHKYTGTGNDGFAFQSGGSRYGGFGNDSVSYNNGLLNPGKTDPTHAII
jgi:hypothetical protein